MQTTRQGPARSRGFTLLEILIVVALIGLLASLTLPSLLASRVAANETAALGMVKSIYDAQQHYRRKEVHPSTPGAFADNFEYLLSGGLLPGALHMQTVSLADHQGYHFATLPHLFGDAVGLRVWAWPISDRTGERSFLMTENGRIYVRRGIFPVFINPADGELLGDGPALGEESVTAPPTS